MIGAFPVDICRDVLALKHRTSSAQSEAIVGEGNIPDLFATDPVGT